MKTETRDRHVCASCGQHFAVVYVQVDPDEATQVAPVPCPHCHAVNRVQIASGAAQASSYRAEKVFH